MAVNQAIRVNNAERALIMLIRALRIDPDKLTADLLKAAAQKDGKNID